MPRPAPFQKDRITIDAGPQGRRWVRADPRHVQKGDIIRGEGLVEDAEYQAIQGGPEDGLRRAVFLMKSGKKVYVSFEDTVVVFSTAPGVLVG